MTLADYKRILFLHVIYADSYEEFKAAYCSAVHARNPRGMYEYISRDSAQKECRKKEKVKC